ncbi:methionyl-tRNA formyltransferase [Flavobacterium sp. RS13.1]|uniref:methionyl-tRNA formyltransferase n=1 Tax=Flavobacterium sp. RS13.1 TaxID=3400345 RepID=UPI003AAFA23F
MEEVNKKIVILCGGKFAFKAIQALANEKFLYGIGIGKGNQLVVNALERECENNGLHFQSFENKKKMQNMREWLDTIQPDYIFSFSFPFLLSEDVLAYGPEKFINFHPGKLPQYRGPMPIFEVLRNQEKETAFCVHFMNSKFDEGNIIFNDPITILPQETYGKLAVRMSARLAQVAVNVAHMVQFASKIPSIPQEEEKSCYYEKPELTDTYIQWRNMDAGQIIALINACNPWNGGADTSLLGEQIKIISAQIEEQKHDNNTMPGMILSTQKEGCIQVACIDNQLIAIQLISTDEGIMSAEEFKANRNLTLHSFN